MPADTQPTVLLAVHQGFAARFLLRTDVMRTLREAGARIVILTPNADEPYMREEFCAPGVELEPLHGEWEIAQRSRLWWLLLHLRMYSLGRPRESSNFIDNYRLFQAEARRRRPWTSRLVHVGRWPLWRSGRLRRALLAIESRLFSPPVHAATFERHRPDLVVTAGMGWFLPDALVLREARRRGIPGAAVIMGWDNATNKGYRGADPDLTVTWSETMADQVVIHHDYPRERIRVGGVPHFDPYAREGALPSRAALCEELGLDPQRRLVFFATRSPASYSHNELVAGKLAQAVSDGAFSAPAQLVIRLHPIALRSVYDTPVEPYQGLAAAHEHVHLDVPTVLSDRLYADMPGSEALRLGALIKHCDVLVNIFSTTSLEAFLADRPVVMVAPDAHRAAAGDAQDAAPERHFADYAHTRALVDRGAARIAGSLDELVALVGEYLDDPRRDSAQRREIAARECGPTDGHAGHRVAGHLLDLLAAREQAATASPNGAGGRSHARERATGEAR